MAACRRTSAASSPGAKRPSCASCSTKSSAPPEARCTLRTLTLRSCRPCRRRRCITLFERPRRSALCRSPIPPAPAISPLSVPSFALGCRARLMPWCGSRREERRGGSDLPDPQTVAVVLDLMDPVGARGHLVGAGRNAGWDVPVGRHARSVAGVAAAPHTSPFLCVKIALLERRGVFLLSSRAPFRRTAL